MSIWKRSTRLETAERKFTALAMLQNIPYRSKTMLKYFAHNRIVNVAVIANVLNAAVTIANYFAVVNNFPSYQGQLTPQVAGEC